MVKHVKVYLKMLLEGEVKLYEVETRFIAFHRSRRLTKAQHRALGEIYELQAPPSN